ncbi:MAG: hypothetical protein HYV09_39900 [Deltaproteobacteria bacterium]|nr:hypothetical protein [Deltaproteobacteria bacterium]
MQQQWQPGPYGQPGYPQGGYAPPPAAGGAYEFSQMENTTIGRLGSRAKTWGICSIVIGLILLVLGVVVIIAAPGEAALPVGGVIAVAALQPVVSGGFYMAAGGAFKNVVDTQGNDVPHMMDAMKKLTNAMRVESIVALLAIVGAVIFGVVLAASH